MKKLTNLMCAALLVTNFGISNNTTHAQTQNKKVQWQQSNGDWYAFDSNGQQLKGWVKDDEKCWYYLDTQTGILKTGWYQESDKWYYLNPVNGIMQTGWKLIKGEWYFFDVTGAMKTGWYQDREHCWYLLDYETGAAHKGWTAGDSTHWYYFNPLNAIMQTGWKFLDNNWYYFLTTGQYAGSMATGEIKIDGVVYHFSDKGILLDDLNQILIDVPESATANKKFDVIFKNIGFNTVSLKVFDKEGKELDAKDYEFVFDKTNSKLSIKSTGQYELIFVCKNADGVETEIRKSIKITSRGGSGGTYVPPNIDIGGGGNGGGDSDSGDHEDSKYTRLHISQPLNLNVTNQTDIKAVAWTVIYNGVEVENTSDYLVIDGLKVVKFFKEGKYDLTAKIVTHDEKVYTSNGHIAVYNNRPNVQSITGIGNDLDMERGVTMPGDDLYFTADVADSDVDNPEQLDIEWKLDDQEVEFSKVGFSIDNVARGDHKLTVTAIDPEGKRSEPLIYRFTAIENSKVIFKFENGTALHVSLPVSYGTVNEHYIDHIDWTVINTGDDSLEENALTVNEADHKFKFNHKGNYRVTATVTDRFGRVTECTSGVYVYNIDPTLPEVDLSHTDFIGSTTAYEGETFSFSVTSIDGDADITPTVVVEKDNPTNRTDNDIQNDTIKEEIDEPNKELEAESNIKLEDPQLLNDLIVGLGEDINLIQDPSNTPNEDHYNEGEDHSEVTDMDQNDSINELPLLDTLEDKESGLTFDWYVDGRLVESGNMGVFTTSFDEYGHHVVSVQAVDADGGKSNSYDFDCMIYKVPTIDFEEKDSPFHISDSISYTINEDGEDTYSSHTLQIIDEATGNLLSEGSDYTVGVSGKTETVHFKKSGSFKLILDVEDIYGRNNQTAYGADACSKSVEVYNHAPVIDTFVSDMSTIKKTVEASTPITFTTSASDADSDDFDYIWFVDGVKISNNADSYTNTFAEGKHKVEVKVKDTYGDESSLSSIEFISMSTPSILLDFSEEAVHLDGGKEYNLNHAYNIASINWTLYDENGQELKNIADYVHIDEFKKGNTKGKIQFIKDGTYTIKASITDIYGDAGIGYERGVAYTNEAPVVSEIKSTYGTVAEPGLEIKYSIDATDSDGDAITYRWYKQNSSGEDVLVQESELASYSVTYDYATENNTSTIIKVIAIDEWGKESETKTFNQSISYKVPEISVNLNDGAVLHNNTNVGYSILNDHNLKGSETVTIMKDGKVVEATTVGQLNNRLLEIAKKNANKGQYQLTVKATDRLGFVYEKSVSFTVANNAPTKPTINKSFTTNNTVKPNTTITIPISMISTDADGDTITYHWTIQQFDAQGKLIKTDTAASTAAGGLTYIVSSGKYTVQLVAVDTWGAESTQNVVMFFANDGGGTGGMELTGSTSVIEENGFDGALIGSVTFTVPEVSGHSGNDYGLIEGYDIKSGKWIQLKKTTTSNGITMALSRSELQNGTISITKLRMTYYTDHDCMYGKSNITYNVDFEFPE